MPTRDEAVRAFSQMDGPSICFDLVRGPEEIARDGADKTFSAELIEEIGDNCLSWIGTRLYRRHMRGKGAAHKAKITLTVELEGEPATVLDVPVRMTIIDGELRLVR